MKGIENLLNGDSTALLETIKDNFPNSIWIVSADLQNNVSWISGAVSKLRGYTPEEVTEQALEDILTKESLQIIYAAIQEELINEQDPDVDKDRVRVIEMEMKCKDGSTIWTKNNVSFLHDEKGQLIAFLGVTEDISEKKLAEQRQELAIKILECLNEGDDLKNTIEKIVVSIRESFGISSISFRILDEDGDFPHYVSRGFSPDYINSTNSILSDSESDSEDSLDSCGLGCLCESVVNGTLDGSRIKKTDHGSFWTGDLPELKRELNDTAYNIRSNCIDEGYNSLALIPIKTREKVLGLMQLAAIKKEIFNQEMIEFFERIVTSIGVAIEKERIKNELTKKEEQLRHSQKLDSIGRFAGGVAHDFNNLLTAIIGYVGFLKESGDISERGVDDLLEIEKAAKRAAALTKQLLAFSRKQVLIKEVVDVNELFIDFQKMLLRLVEENIDINFWPSKEDIFVKADKSQLEQIVMNLVVNARDAMPNGGLITVNTKKKVFPKDKYVNNERIKAGEYVSIMVSDNGVGIEPEHLSEIFEPFFTTKSVHKGSGLGLSVVYGIVKQHGGDIIVESEVGKGTTFEVLLPLSHEEKSEKYTENKDSKEKLLDGRRIFVIEDDKGIQRIMRRLLKSQGAEAFFALTAEEAYKIFAEQDGDFDIIVSDIVLPDGSGPDIVADLREKGFKGALLLTSGYPYDSDIYDMTKGKSIPFIHKPFKPSSIIQRISDLIKASK